jgi:hypothetical protein
MRFAQSLIFDDTVVIDDEMVLCLDDAADTLRFTRIVEEELPIDPDATSFYDLGEAPVSKRYVGRSLARHQKLCVARQEADALREAFDEGWDVAPELAFVECQLARLEEQS